MPYDVKAKHGELIAFLSEQYKLYSAARGAFLRAEHDREWDRYQARKLKEIAGSRTVEQDYQDYEEDIAWEKTNEDKKRMDDAAVKLHMAVRHAIKHYSYWHVGRIRSASGIERFDWFMFMTPVCLPSYYSEDPEDEKKSDDWIQAVKLVDNFSLEGMSGKQYAYEVFKRANNLLDMKNAQAVG